MYEKCKKTIVDWGEFRCAFIIRSSMKSEYTRRMRIALKVVLYFQVFVSLEDACYVFPADTPDPCRNHVCQYGARCAPSNGGRNATCECPSTCPNYGDHSKSKPICGSDGLNYANHCELEKAACISNTTISVKYEGYCGTALRNYHNFITLYIIKRLYTYLS